MIESIEHILNAVVIQICSICLVKEPSNCLHNWAIGIQKILEFLKTVQLIRKRSYIVYKVCINHDHGMNLSNFHAFESGKLSKCHLKSNTCRIDRRFKILKNKQDHRGLPLPWGNTHYITIQPLS